MGVPLFSWATPADMVCVLLSPQRADNDTDVIPESPLQRIGEVCW